MVIVRNRYQKWKEHDEISNIFNFEVTDVKVRHFTVILMFKKVPRLLGKTSPRMLLSFVTCTYSARFQDARHNNLHVQNQSTVIGQKTWPLGIPRVSSRFHCCQSNGWKCEANFKVQ